MKLWRWLKTQHIWQSVLSHHTSDECNKHQCLIVMMMFNSSPLKCFSAALNINVSSRVCHFITFNPNLGFILYIWVSCVTSKSASYTINYCYWNMSWLIKKKATNDAKTMKILSLFTILTGTSWQLKWIAILGYYKQYESITQHTYTWRNGAVGQSYMFPQCWVSTDSIPLFAYTGYCQQSSCI